MLSRHAVGIGLVAAHEDEVLLLMLLERAVALEGL